MNTYGQYIPLDSTKSKNNFNSDYSQTHRPHSTPKNSYLSVKSIHGSLPPFTNSIWLRNGATKKISTSQKITLKLKSGTNNNSKRQMLKNPQKKKEENRVPLARRQVKANPPPPKPKPRPRNDDKKQ